MSIIYEALRKVEAGKSQNLEIERRRLRNNKQEKMRGRYKLRPLIYTFLAVFALSSLLAYFSLKIFSVKVAPLLENRKISALQPPRVKIKKERLSLPKENIQNDVQYQLQGIIYTQEDPLALINGRRLQKGDKIGGATLVSISDEGVELETKEGKIHLPLE